MTAIDAEKHEVVGQVAAECSPLVAMTLWLMAERAKGDQSAWSALLRTLPVRHPLTHWIPLPPLGPSPFDMFTLGTPPYHRVSVTLQGIGLRVSVTLQGIGLRV